MHEYTVEPGFRFEIIDFWDKGISYEVTQIGDEDVQCKIIENKYAWGDYQEGKITVYHMDSIQGWLAAKRIIALPHGYQCFDCKEEFEGDLHYLCPICRGNQ
jgi:hypothetical protein